MQKDDMIYRQAVLDVIEREQFKGDAISEIEKLPPHSQKSSDVRIVCIMEVLIRIVR